MMCVHMDRTGQGRIGRDVSSCECGAPCSGGQAGQDDTLMNAKGKCGRERP